MTQTDSDRDILASDLEAAMSQDGVNMERLAELIAKAMDERPKPAPDPVNRAQKIVGLIGGSLGVVAVFVSAVGWAISLQGQVAGVALDVAEVRQTLARVDDSSRQTERDAWGRSDHEAYHRDQIEPLIERIRVLELQAAGNGR